MCVGVGVGVCVSQVFFVGVFCCCCVAFLLLFVFGVYTYNCYSTVKLIVVTLYTSGTGSNLSGYYREVV